MTRPFAPDFARFSKGPHLYRDRPVIQASPSIHSRPRPKGTRSPREIIANCDSIASQGLEPRERRHFATIGATMSDEWKSGFVKILQGSTLEQSRVDAAIALKEQHLPKRIYKYRWDCAESRDCLNTDSVWMASPNSYNDPYDCSIMLPTTPPTTPLKRLLEARLVKVIIKAHKLHEHLSPEQIKAALTSSEPLKEIVEYFSSLPSAPQGRDWGNEASSFSAAVSGLASAATETIAEWRKFAKTCSFSAVPDSLLMWSHYADHHRGLCIEYDLRSLGDSNHFFRKNLYPVLYSAEPYDLSPFGEGLAGGPETRGDFQPMHLLLAMLTKFEGWQYENEWRLFDEKPGIVDDGKKEGPAPSRIFLGERFDDSKGKDLLAICKKKEISISRMRLAKVKFQVMAEEFWQ
jgi:hypothetical protein